MIGQRLKLARKKAGFSLRQLADELGGLVSAQAISKYERDEMMPGSAILLALSKALSVPLGFFMESPELALSNVDFRKKSNTRASERAEVEVAVLEWIAPYLQIEHLLGLESSDWHSPLLQPRKVSSPEEVEALALEVREKWQLGLAPIANLTELLEEKGLKVCVKVLPEKVSGLTCFVADSSEKTGVPVIVVNQAHSLERRRMTLAHELAHRLLDTAHLTEHESERAANRFAGAFLIPAPHLREAIGKQRQHLSFPEIMDLKHFYRISAAALVVRLKDLGIISEGTMIYVFQNMGRSWRLDEPLPLEAGCDDALEKPERFERLCYWALAEELISVSRAAELLGCSILDVKKRLKGLS